MVNSSAKTELLINTRSRQAKEHLALVRKSCEINNIPIDNETLLTKKVRLDDVISDIIKRKPELLIVGGGDGTISEIVDHLASTGIVIGLLPLGTTNNFARSIAVPLEIEDAIKLIATTKPRSVDLGNIDGDLFTNVAGVGLSARIARASTDAFKRKFGRFAYALIGLRLFISNKPFRATIRDKSGGLQLHVETHQIIIANGRFHAGKEIATDAAMDSQELVIFTLGERSKWSFLWHLLDFYIGKRKKISHTSYMIGRNIEIITDSEQPVELDGEITHSTPISATVSPSAIKIHCGPRQLNKKP